MKWHRTYELYFERQTHINRLRARREFNTVEMNSTKLVVIFINRVSGLGYALTSLVVQIQKQEIANVLLNALTSQSESVCTTFDAIV